MLKTIDFSKKKDFKAECVLHILSFVLVLILKLLRSLFHDRAAIQNMLSMKIVVE